MLLYEVVWACRLGMSNFMASFWDSNRHVNAQGIEVKGRCRTLYIVHPQWRSGQESQKHRDSNRCFTGLACCPWNILNPFSRFHEDCWYFQVDVTFPWSAVVKLRALKTLLAGMKQLCYVNVPINLTGLWSKNQESRITFTREMWKCDWSP